MVPDGDVLELPDVPLVPEVPDGEVSVMPPAPDDEPEVPLVPGVVEVVSPVPDEEVPVVLPVSDDEPDVLPVAGVEPEVLPVSDGEVPDVPLVPDGDEPDVLPVSDAAPAAPDEAPDDAPDASASFLALAFFAFFAFLAFFAGAASSSPLAPEVMPCPSRSWRAWISIARCSTSAARAGSVLSRISLVGDCAWPTAATDSMQTNNAIGVFFIVASIKEWKRTAWHVTSQLDACLPGMLRHALMFVRGAARRRTGEAGFRPAAGQCKA